MRYPVYQRTSRDPDLPLVAHEHDGVMATTVGSGTAGRHNATVSDLSEPLGYRLITGPDDAEFCARVSGLLDQGYRLYGSPALTFNGERVIAAQALVLPDSAGPEPSEHSPR